ncbi:MAG TPA: type I-C CRISPR-associated protein Cas8c/Csd1 [Treponemataceae bacterium]|nr:type I-C CRISPR-associated protein Cas8c/Csd1 [Treponemataceae bacterium]
MILQSLKQYYDRKACDPESAIATEGWEWKEIPFVVVIDINGAFMNIEDTREWDGKKKRGKIFLVPQGVKRAAGIAANLLWDTATYMFGIVKTEGLDEKKTEKVLLRATAQKKAFMKRIKDTLNESDRKDAVLKFLISVTLEDLEKTDVWNDFYNGNPNISIRFENELELFCMSQEVISALDQLNKKKQPDGFCLVTGEQDAISTLHTSIKGVWGAQSSGANIVSFNLKAFQSYGKMQGLNAPVGKTAMFAYTTALNTLLARDSKQRMQIGDASAVFWSEKKTFFEESFSVFFSEPEKDDPDAHTRSVQTLFDSVKNGAYESDEGNIKFFILGLSPNAARLSIRLWKTGTVSEFAVNIKQHFEDLAIIKPENEPAFYSLWRILVNAATQDKSENIPPHIAGEFMRSILDGTPYPQSILQAVIRRIKSDTENRVKPVRASLIKAYLNRYMRIHPNIEEKELEMALDTEQSSVGYQLGRLFAALEKIQEEGNPGLNATIRQRYYGAACSSPVTVFSTLMRLKNHHLAKIENHGRVVNLERLVGEIVSHFDDFPAHLNLHEQGKFAIGYYHQRQSFFTKKEKIEI